MLFALPSPYLDGGISMQLLPLYFGIDTFQQCSYFQTQTIRGEKSTEQDFLFFPRSFLTVQ